MRVLITGGAGYIGTSLIPMLIAQGHGVICLDPRAHELPALLPGLDRGDLEIVAGSVLDGDLVAALAGRCDGVIHLAALVGAPACDAEPERAHRLNVEGTRALLSAVPRDLPLVLASTCSVYGRVRAAICTEEEPAAPLSLYAATKAVAEQAVTARGGVALRFVTLYGASPRFRWDLLVHTFLRLAARGERLDLFDPDAYRPLLHVQDASRALIFGLEHVSQLRGARFNVSAGSQALTKREIAACIGRLVPFAVNIDRRNADPDERDYRVSSARIEALGYRATIDFRQALPALLESVRSGLELEEGLWPSASRFRRSA